MQEARVNIQSPSLIIKTRPVGFHPAANAVCPELDLCYVCYVTAALGAERMVFIRIYVLSYKVTQEEPHVSYTKRPEGHFTVS